MLEIVENSEENKLWTEHTPIELKMNYKMKHNETYFFLNWITKDGFLFLKKIFWVFLLSNLQHVVNRLQTTSWRKNTYF